MEVTEQCMRKLEPLAMEGLEPIPVATMIHMIEMALEGHKPLVDMTELEQIEQKAQVGLEDPGLNLKGELEAVLETLMSPGEWEIEIDSAVMVQEESQREIESGGVLQITKEVQQAGKAQELIHHLAEVMKVRMKEELSLVIMTEQMMGATGEHIQVHMIELLSILGEEDILVDMTEQLKMVPEHTLLDMTE